MFPKHVSLEYPLPPQGTHNNIFNQWCLLILVHRRREKPTGPPINNPKVWDRGISGIWPVRSGSVSYQVLPCPTTKCDGHLSQQKITDFHEHGRFLWIWVRSRPTLVRTVEWIWWKNSGLLQPASLPLISAGPRDSASYLTAVISGARVCQAQHAQHHGREAPLHPIIISIVWPPSVTPLWLLWVHFFRLKGKAIWEEPLPRSLNSLSALRSMWKEPDLVLEDGTHNRGCVGNSSPSLSHWIRLVPCV